MDGRKKQRMCIDVSFIGHVAYGIESEDRLREIRDAVEEAFLAWHASIAIRGIYLTAEKVEVYWREVMPMIVVDDVEKPS